MQRYSAFALVRQALGYHTGWERAWGSPEPRRRYQVIIVGGGGHGLATAYYLAKNHGIRDVAVLEKGWLGGGNTGRNTTIIRSNYLQPASAAIYELPQALRGAEPAAELQRHVQPARRDDAVPDRARAARHAKRTAHANRAAQIETRLVDPAFVKKVCPIIETGRPALSGAGRAVAAARRHGAPRRGGLGLCAGGRRSGRRHHPAMRGDGRRRRGRPRARRADHARRDRLRHALHGRRRQRQRAGRDGRVPPADRIGAAAGAGQRADQARAWTSSSWRTRCTAT